MDQIYNDVGKTLLAKLRKTDPKSPKLRLYRGMDAEEAHAILAWFYGQKSQVEKGIAGSRSKVDAKDVSRLLKDHKNPGILPIKGHLGDYAQAKHYAKTGMMLEFTLKPGAHELLFDAEYMAVQRAGRKGTSQIFEAAVSRGRTLYPKAESGAEGGLAGYVGVKSEDHGDFSLTMGRSDATHLLFQLMIESIRVVRR